MLRRYIRKTTLYKDEISNEIGLVAGINMKNVYIIHYIINNYFEYTYGKNRDFHEYGDWYYLSLLGSDSFFDLFFIVVR